MIMSALNLKFKLHNYRLYILGSFIKIEKKRYFFSQNVQKVKCNK